MNTLLKSAYMISFLRWGLRLHGVFHVFELAASIYEGAYITAIIVFFAASIEVLSSFVIPNEHVHFKGVLPTVHEKCDDSEKK